MKNIFLDLETTGTNPSKNGIIQIGFIIEIDGKITESHDMKVKPIVGDIVEHDALEINNITLKDIESFQDARTAYNTFTRILSKYVNKYDRKDKFNLIGYNISFDDDFLRQWFKKLGDNYYGSFFFFPPIDVMNIAAVNLIETRNTLPNFKLFTTAGALGIEIDEARLHDAMYDIELTRKLFYKLKKGNEK